MKIGIEDVLMPPALALVFLVLGWPYARVLRGGKPLNTVQKKMLMYGFWYVLGMGYMVVTASALRLPEWTWIALIVAWSFLLALFAWLRYRQNSSPESDKKL